MAVAFSMFVNVSNKYMVDTTIRYGFRWAIDVLGKIEGI